MISSSSNSQIKNIVKLLSSGKARKIQNAFVVEGIRMFKEIPSDKIKMVYLSESFYEKNKGVVGDISYELVADNVFREMSDTITPQGALGIVECCHYEIKDIIAKQNPFVIVIENLQDPGNLGTIIRTCEGAGVDGIIINSNTVDIYNPKVIRATMGAIFRVPFVITDNIINTVELLKARNITTYAAHLNGNSFYKENFKAGTAFLIGNEGNGLTKEITEHSDKLIKIPMKGNVESLNAATAATVLMYETLRQREN